MGIADRREREKQALREKIMDTARSIFAAEGYEAVSMRRIADAIEYAPAAIYAHFKDKEDLFQQICSCDFARFHLSQSHVAENPDPVERIKGMGHAYIRFAVENPNHFRLMFLDPPDIKPSAEAMKGRGDPSVDGYALFRSFVADAMAAGRFRREFRDVEMLTQLFWAGVHGVASIAVTYTNDPWIELSPVNKLADAMVESILRGTLADDANAVKTGKAKPKASPKKRGAK